VWSGKSTVIGHVTKCVGFFRNFERANLCDDKSFPLIQIFECIVDREEANDKDREDDEEAVVDKAGEDEEEDILETGSLKFLLKARIAQQHSLKC
jgi:hypothetical protein